MNDIYLDLVDIYDHIEDDINLLYHFIPRIEEIIEEGNRTEMSGLFGYLQVTNNILKRKISNGADMDIIRLASSAVKRSLLILLQTLEMYIGVNAGGKRYSAVIDYHPTNHY